MKWTLDWLNDYLKTDASAPQIADTLTRIGLEGEDVITPISPIAIIIDTLILANIICLRIDGCFVVVVECRSKYFSYVAVVRATCHFGVYVPRLQILLFYFKVHNRPQKLNND